jgi:hypothetical protein
MNTDPKVNCVVFEVKRLWKKETFVEEALTQADDGIMMAWRAVQSKTGARPSQVRRIFSEWEPSAEDMVFISDTFPRAEVSYSFSRPSADGWEEAFQEVSRALQAEAAGQLASEFQERRDKGEAPLFPILRTYEPGDVFAETVVHRSIGADLAVFLAHVGSTPRNTIGIDYVMRNSIDASEETINGLFETAWQNLRSGLQVSVGEAAGEKIFTFSHPSNMAASALCLPDFYDQVRSWLGQEEVFVAFTDPANLFVALPDSQVAEKLRQAVEHSDYWGAVALTPACYCLNSSGMRRVAARAAAT